MQIFCSFNIFGKFEPTLNLILYHIGLIRLFYSLNAQLLYSQIYMKAQDIAEAIVFAFELEAIADGIQAHHRQEANNKTKKSEELNLWFLMGDNGRHILQLFGYHLANKMKQKTFYDMGKSLSQVLLSYDEFAKYCHTVWPEMNRFSNVLPVLFRILKNRYGVVSLREMDYFLEICRKQINPFTAEIKQSIPPHQLRLFMQLLAQQCEREDLHNTGFVQKIFLEEIYKKTLKRPPPQWPKALYNANNINEISYKLLLGPEYFTAGHTIANYIISKFIAKIVRVIKKAGVILKKKGDKRSSKKNKTSRVIRPAERMKNEKLLQKYIETNKPKKIQENSRNQFMVKGLILDIIESVVDMKFRDGEADEVEQDKVIKSVYVAEPQFPEMEFDNPGIKIQQIKFIGNNGLGLYVWNNKGYLIDNVRSLKKSQFELNLSSVFKSSPVIGYEVVDDTIYLLKENGLLYSWPVAGDTFLHQIQTSFLKPLSPPDSDGNSFLQIKEGLVVVNCTHQPNSRFELYSLDLAYVASIELNPSQFDVTYKYCAQSRLAASSLKKLALDKKVKDIDEFKQLTGQQSNSALEFISMIIKAYEDKQLKIGRIIQLAQWVLQFMNFNQLGFPLHIHEKLCNKNYNSELVSYLLKLGYISEATSHQIEAFKEKNCIKFIQNRKLELLSLFEDSVLEPIKSPFIDKQGFLSWVAPACLMDLEVKALVESLKFRPDGRVDMTKLYYNEHYRRLVDSRYNRFIPERYKYLEVPPVCVKQYIPVPSSQLIVFCLSFPILPSLFVSSLVTGDLLHSHNLENQTSIPPRIKMCDRNGYIFGVANRSINLWSSTGLATSKSLDPIMSWPWIQSTQIIDISIIYQLSTIVTLTKDCIKIWDFDELCRQKESRHTFQLKPGYKAMEKQGGLNSPLRLYKKKILLRQTGSSLFYAITPNECVMVGAVSVAKTEKYYVKSFLINKLKIAINSKKQHYQIPTRLMRQLQLMALKRKNLPPLNRSRWMNDNEKGTMHRIVQHLKQNIESVGNVEVNTSLKPELQQKISFLAHELSNIYNRNMFKNNEESSRLDNIFKLITLKSMKDLEGLLQPKFLELYKLPHDHGFELSRMLEDCLSTKEKKAVNRSLYVLSLIEKYSRSMVHAGHKLIKLVSEDRRSIDQNCVLSLLPTKLPLDPRIITKSVRLLNSLESPLELVASIMSNYLPTRYRFLVPRYIKQIVSCRQSPELSEYVSNRYENDPTPAEIETRFLNQQSPLGIQQYLRTQGLLKFAHEHVVPIFPLAAACNYSLIEGLMCLKIITEDQAYYYCVRQSLHPEQRLSSKQNVTSQGDEDYIDAISQQIQKKVRQQNIQLEYPKLTYAFFKQRLFNGENCDNFFFGFLHGDRSDLQIQTSNLESCFASVRRKLRLQYSQSQWQYIMGDKIKVVKPFASKLLQRFPMDFRAVTVNDLRTGLMNYIEQEKVYEDIAKRAAYACTSSLDKLAQWKKTSGEGLETEGMWIDMNHFFRFAEDYNPLLLELEKPVAQPNKEIKIPMYAFLNRLVGDFHLLSIIKFRQLLTLSLRPLSITDAEETIQRYFKQMKQISLFDMQDILGQDYSVIGRYLIDKYHRMDYQHRFTIIAGKVSSTQVSQLLTSKAITNYLFGDALRGLNELLPFQQINNAIRSHLVQPAAKAMSQTFLSALSPRYQELIEYQLKKTSIMPALALAQLLHHKESQIPVVICLLKFITGEPNSAQIISLSPVLNYIRSDESLKGRQRYKDYLQNLLSQIKGKNLVSLFLDQCQPQNLPFTEEDQPKQYTFTQEHMEDILGSKSMWYINFKPCATARQFIDHARLKQRQSQRLSDAIAFFTQNCVCRVGINEIMQMIGEGAEFPDFYYKLKSNFKALSKVSTESLLLVYEAVVSSSRNKKCDAAGMRALCQQYIPTHKKMEWICALYDRDLISDPLQHEQQVLEYELKIERVKNLYETQNQSTRELEKQAVKQSLHYHKYLVYKYLSNDATKMKQLSSCMKENNENEARKLLQVYGVIDPIHVAQLIKYFANEPTYLEQKKYAGSDSPIEQIKKVIEAIRVNKSLLNFPINPEIFKQNPTVHDSIVKIQQSKVYEQFMSLGSGEYFLSLHALLAYCQSILLSKLTSSEQILRVQSQVRDFLIKRDLAPAKLYELLDLSTFDNIVRYLPEVALLGSESDQEIVNTFKIVSEIARPERLNLKYPINSSDFEILLSELSVENQNYRKQYQHIYTELDMFGVGYVNLNDIPKYRGTIPAFLSPYVYIPSYIDYITEQDKAKRGSLPSKYVGPILEPLEDKVLRMKVKQKLLKYEIPVHKSQKTKLIKVDVCLAIMGEFGIAQNHQYHQFIKQKFTMQSCGLLDLSGIIDWLTNSLLEQKKQNVQRQDLDVRAGKTESLIQEVDNEGGLYAFVSMKKTQPEQLQKLYVLLLQLSNDKTKALTLILASIPSKSNQKFQAAVAILKQLAESYFRQVKKWDTFNNHFCREIKNMAQVYYGLVFKFYQTHIRVDMHQIYSDASEKGELTLLTLWRYIEEKGITGYSRADVNELFSAIDINSDKRLSYFEFCQFWMACQQLFQSEDSEKYSLCTKIDQINTEVKNAFLELCCVELHNSYTEKISIDDLVRFTNMPNVEKVDFIARAVNSASISKGPASGALNTRIQMSKSKLKIMMDKMKVNLTTKKQLVQNLLIEATKPYIYSYIQEGYNAQSLAKIIMLKYPNLGYLILQYFEDLCQMNVQILAQKYKDVKQDSQLSQEPSKKSDRVRIMANLVSNIEESYRKHPLKVKAYEHKELGGSVAYSLLTEQVVKNLTRVSNQVKQTLNYLNKIEMPSIAVNYELDILHYNQFEEPKSRLKSAQISGLRQLPHQMVIEDLNQPQLRIKSVLYSKKPINKSNLDSLADCTIYRQIEWKDTDFVCKSENKVNLLQHAQLYSDPEISLIPLNVETSNRFRVEGAYAYKKQYAPMIMMRAVACPDPEEAVDQVMSVLKCINDKLVYCYYKYAVTGLLVMPNNILVNINDNTDLKFDHFVSGLSLNANAIKNRDQTVTYLDGIDSKNLLNMNRPYPPEAELGTLTEAIDVYMLAHIVYGMFRHTLNPADSQIPQVLLQSCEEEPLWDWTSSLHEVAAARIKHDGKLSEKEQQLWMLLFECSYHDWFMRPRVYQLQQMIDNYFEDSAAHVHTQIFEASNEIEEFLACLGEGRINEASEKLKVIAAGHWKLSEIIKFRQTFETYSQFDTEVLQYFNSVMESYVKSDSTEEDPHKMRAFLSCAVDYILMIPASNSGQCYLTNAAFKGLLNDRKVKRYLCWCDENWKIEEYEINKKVEKINMQDKLEELHKNSSFYHDISTLAQCRVALAEGEAAKRSETSKKVAISFVQSCLISNNINKVYAVYRSGILCSIYCYLAKEELQANVMSIFQIATACFNPTLGINRFRSVDQVYKVIMVISNSIKPSKPSPTKTASTKLKQTASMTNSVQPSSQNADNESIVSMQDFVNNYYTLSGQECKEVVLKEICRTQLCTLPVLTYLMNQVEISKLEKIVINLTYDKDSARALRSPVVGGYAHKLKQSKMESSLAQIREAISVHTECLSLCQISTAPIEHSSYPQVLREHLQYYQWYCQLDSEQISVRYQKNYYAYFQSFVAKAQKLYDSEIKEAHQNATSLEIVALVVKAHRIMYEIWTQLPCHPDFTAATLRFLMTALEHIYSADSVYLKSKVSSQVGPDILYVLRRLWVEEASINTHDLVQIALMNGFVQFYCRMVVKQQELMQDYIGKNVQNIHMTDNYYPEAEFRLTCFHLFLSNSRYRTEISQLLIANKFPAYIVDTMLNSTLTLDLRFYKANNQVVPFRFCHPLRAQAIALIGFALSFEGSFIANDICSKLIAYLPTELKNVDCDDLESLPDRMRWVESLWLLTNITTSDNERLKYQFVNLRLHELLTSQIGKHPFLNRFFPRMTQTLSNTDLFMSSFARSQIK